MLPETRSPSSLPRSPRDGCATGRGVGKQTPATRGRRSLGTRVSGCSCLGGCLPCQWIQFADLWDAVAGVGPGTSLSDKVAAAQAALATNDVPEACSIPKALVNQFDA